MRCVEMKLSGQGEIDNLEKCVYCHQVVAH